MKKTLLTMLVLIGLCGAYSVNANIYGSSLVSWWTLDSGAAADKSGNGNNGTLVNAPTAVTGKLAQALSFNGSTQYVLGSNGITTSPLTMCGWFKYTSGVVALADLSTGTANWDGWYIQVNGGNWFFEAVSNQNFGAGAVGATARVGSWDFVCGVVTNDSSRTIYVNGVAGGTDTSAITPVIGSQKLSIGASVRGAGNIDNYFNGAIDDVRLYNRALIIGDIRQLYYQGFSKHGNVF